MQTQINNPFGPVIYAYTRADALLDGLLVDAGPIAREAGFKVPVALTSSVWADCIGWSDADSDDQTPQDLQGRLWDVLFMAFIAGSNHPDRQEVRFKVARVPRDGRSRSPEIVDLKMHVGPGVAGEPVITIMHPWED